MLDSVNMEQTRCDVANLLAEDAGIMVGTLAEQLNVSEAQVTFALPDEMVVSVSAEYAQTILEALPSWGKVTTIVHSCGSVFEVKATFPKGKFAYGYYNLMGRDGELHGHLRIDLITYIAFVSKPFRKSDSHYIGFYDAQGGCMFKVYLGRDEHRRLFEHQVVNFQDLKKELS